MEGGAPPAPTLQARWKGATPGCAFYLTPAPPRWPGSDAQKARRGSGIKKDEARYIHAAPSSELPER